MTRIAIRTYRVSKLQPIADVPPFYVRFNFILMSHVVDRA